MIRTKRLSVSHGVQAVDIRQSSSLNPVTLIKPHLRHREMR